MHHFHFSSKRYLLYFKKQIFPWMSMQFRSGNTVEEKKILDKLLLLLFCLFVCFLIGRKIRLKNKSVPNSSKWETLFFQTLLRTWDKYKDKTKWLGLFYFISLPSSSWCSRLPLPYPPPSHIDILIPWPLSYSLWFSALLFCFFSSFHDQPNYSLMPLLPEIKRTPTKKISNPFVKWKQLHLTILYWN